MKKRLIAMLLCFLSLFTFCGCSFRADKCKLTGTYELSGVQKNDVYYKKGDLYYGMIVGGEIISLKIHSNWTFEGKISYTSDVSFEVKRRGQSYLFIQRKLYPLCAGKRLAIFDPQPYPHGKGTGVFPQKRRFSDPLLA